MIIFKNREEAGKLLAEFLKTYNFDKSKTVILAIPRGGIPIAAEISKVLNIPFSLIIAKKLTPLNETETAFGAITPDGNYYIDKLMMKYMGIDEKKFEIIKEKTLSEIKRRVNSYLNGKEPEIENKDVIIVDDGIATGYTSIAAAIYAKNKRANKVYLAVPVCPEDSIQRVKNFFDDVICLYPIKTKFFAVGAYYQDFHQLTDEDVYKFIEKNIGG